MDPNKMREQIFEIIRNQMDMNDPIETKLTYDRLLGEGYDEFAVMQYLGQCVAVEIYDAIKYQKPFDEARYVRNLKKLPEEPFED